MLIALAWLALVLVHAPPAFAAFSPTIRRRMYGIEETPQLAVILAHRGVLFLAVAAVCLYAAFEAGARPAAAIVAAVSVIGFLTIYASAGAPKGPLRPIAIADLVAAGPLALVALDAWAR